MSHALDPRFALSAAQVPDLLRPGAPVRWAEGPLLPRTVTHVRDTKAVLCAGLFDMHGLTRNEEHIVEVDDLVLDLTQPLGAPLAYNWLRYREKAQPWMLWMTSPLEVKLSLHILRASVMEVVVGREPVAGVQQPWSTPSVSDLLERVPLDTLGSEAFDIYAKVAPNPKKYGFGWTVAGFGLDARLRTFGEGPECGAEGQALADACLLGLRQALLETDGTVRCPGDVPVACSPIPPGEVAISDLPPSTAFLFRKKSVTVAAAKWDGSIASGEAIRAALGECVQVHAEKDDPRPPRLVCVTLEGVMTAASGSWILRGVKDEVYPCRADLFEATYEIAYPNPLNKP
jgi:hypothetical protein